MRPAAMALVLLALALSASASPPIVISPDRFFVYPSPLPADGAEGINRTISALNLSPDYTWGAHPRATLEFTPHSTATGALVEIRSMEREPNGIITHWSITQRVNHSRGELLYVIPKDLHIGVEFDTNDSLNTSGPHLLTLFAPPPGLQSEGDTLPERAENLSRRLGLPNATHQEWNITIHAPAANLPIRMFGQHEHTQLVLDCSNCSLALRHEQPNARNLEFAAAYFTPDGALVAFQTSRWLNWSQVLPEEQLIERARDRLYARHGYNATNFTLESRHLTPGSPVVESTWLVDLQPTSKRVWSSLRVNQDAATGLLSAMPYDLRADPTLIPRPPAGAYPQPSDPAPRPIPSDLAVVLTGLLLAVYLFRSRRG